MINPATIKVKENVLKNWIKVALSTLNPPIYI